MTTSSPPARTRLPANPFATRYTRPGALPPLDALGRPRDVSRLVDFVLLRGGAAAVVGPHGTGKSTLLVAIAAELAARGRLAGCVTLRRWLDAPLVVRSLAAAPRGSTLCIDGWERMTPPIGGLARLLAVTRGCGLIVTTHRPCRMPLTVRTASSPRLFDRLVERLPDHGGRIGPADLARALARHGGNLRDSLAELYDLFEIAIRRPDGSCRL